MGRGTALRNVRVSDELWTAARAAAARAGYTDLSAFLRDALARLVKEHPPTKQ